MLQKYCYIIFSFLFLSFHAVLSSPNPTFPDQNVQSNKTGKSIIYHLYVQDTLVNFNGKERHAIAVNGQIPAPTLYFSEGDTAVIYVHNTLDKEVSTHWHGLLLPNDQDGVPYLTTAPIKSGTTHQFIFPIKQTGTFWYHSHTMFQEQMGLYGSIVIYGKDEKKQKEEILQLSDWTDIRPKEVMRLLKRNSDWFEIKKDAVQSYGEAIVKGRLKDRVKFDWIRMPGVDISDVYYKTYLMQGLPEKNYPDYKKGDSIRLRIINGSTASYFWLQFAGGKMKVITADGNKVQPVEVDKLLIGTAETYDVMIVLPDDKRYELRATAQDIKGQSSAFFGNGQTIVAQDIPSMDYFQTMHEMNVMMKKMKKMGMKMTMGLKMESGSMNKMKHSPTDNRKDMDASDSMKMKKPMMKMPPLTGFDVPPGNHPEDVVLSYDMLKSDTVTSLSEDRPWHEIHLTLSGNMLRYVWSINGVPFSDLNEKVKITKGENVRIYFHNATMMEHPMHLHGHFFRVVNDNGDYSPMKHTLSVNPMKTSVIEFAATEDKDWFLHCHTLYHMVAGMATVISYSGTQSEVQQKYAKDFPHFQRGHGRLNFTWASVQVQSQGIFANVTLSGLKWQASERFSANWKGEYESEAYLRRFIDKRQFLSAYIESDNRYIIKEEEINGEQVTVKEHKDLFAAGVSYLLPLFVMVDGRIDHKGNLRLQVGRKDIPLTKRARLDLSWNTDNEYEIDLHYVLRRNIGLSGSYDSDYGWGAGVYLKY